MDQNDMNKLQEFVKQEVKRSIYGFSQQHHQSADFTNPMREFAEQSQYNLAKIPDHVHNGTDSQRLDPASLLGFPVVASAPTDPALNGTMRFYWDGSTYAIYARINNDWKRFVSA